jgi:hypothetical protein
MAATFANQEIIGTGMTVYGQVIKIAKVNYTEEIPGVGKQSFAVSVEGGNGYAPVTYGFVSESDVQKFLHETGEQEFDTFDRNGQPFKDVRTALGVPRGMVTLDSKTGAEIDTQKNADTQLKNQTEKTK